MIRGRATAAAAAAFAFARPAEAHIVGSRLGDFYTGALHPLTGIEDVVLWLALGALAGSQEVTRARLPVMLFPAGLMLGLLAGFEIGSGVASPLVDAAMMTALGGLLALGRSLPAAVIAALTLLLALSRGVANTAGAAPGTNRVLFAAGFVAAGYATITLVMGATAAFRSAGSGWRAIAVRAAGSWIAAVGIMFGGYALAIR